MDLTRRGMLGILAAGVAPAIIRTPGLLMPIRPVLVVPLGIPRLRVHLAWTYSIPPSGLARKSGLCTTFTSALPGETINLAPHGRNVRLLSAVVDGVERVDVPHDLAVLIV